MKFVIRLLDLNFNKQSKLLFWAVIFIAVVFFHACNKDTETPILHGTPYEFPEFQFLPSKLNIPADNPMTVEGVELGRYLFYDGRLSGRTHPDSLMSCASCHRPSKGFEFGMDEFPDGHPRSIPKEGYPEGKPLQNVTLPTVNLVFNSNGYMWNGFLEETNEKTSIPGYDFTGVVNPKLKNLEAFSFMVTGADHEMDGNIQMTMDAISGDPIYPPMFEKAFGSDSITAERISKAIAQFIRSIVSYNSKFHKWLRHEVEFTAAEERGHDMFFSETADCFHCHGGTSLLTTNKYFNNAKDSVFTDLKDRYSITEDPSDIGAFRAPSLLNVELNGPYMHDGRFKTLDEVIDFYSEGLVYSEHVNPLMKNVSTGGIRLTEQQKADLKAFLLTLTDHEFINNPDYGPPDDLGQWLVE